MENLIRRIGRGIAPLVLTGALALGACTGTYQPRGFNESKDMINFLQNKEDSYLNKKDRCILAKHNNGLHRGENEDALTNATINDEPLIIGDEIVQRCYVNSTSVGKQDSYLVLSVQKQGADVTYTINQRNGEVEMVEIYNLAGGTVRAFYPNDKEVMGVAEKKVKGYLDSIKNYNAGIERKRTQKAIDTLK